MKPRLPEYPTDEQRQAYEWDRAMQRAFKGIYSRPVRLSWLAKAGKRAEQEGRA